MAFVDSFCYLCQGLPPRGPPHVRQISTMLQFPLFTETVSWRVYPSLSSSPTWLQLYPLTTTWLPLCLRWQPPILTRLVSSFQFRFSLPCTEKENVHLFPCDPAHHTQSALSWSTAPLFMLSSHVRMYNRTYSCLWYLQSAWYVGNYCSFCCSCLISQTLWGNEVIERRAMGQHLSVRICHHRDLTSKKALGLVISSAAL